MRFVTFLVSARAMLLKTAVSVPRPCGLVIRIRAVFLSDGGFQMEWLAARLCDLGLLHGVIAKIGQQYRVSIISEGWRCQKARVVTARAECDDWLWC